MDYLDTSHQNVAWFKDRDENNELIIRPSFQRKPVWTDPQKSFLIDSILRGYPVPELYLQSKVTPEGEQEYVIVDGQQRVRACLEFLDDKFTLGGWNNVSRREEPLFDGYCFSELPPDAKKTIFSYKFVVRSVPDVAEVEIRTVFSRLNQNVIALNQQELRHATYWGAFIQLIQELGTDEFWDDAGVFTQNDLKRMLNDEFISELVVAFLNGPQNKKASLNDWYEKYEKAFNSETKVRGSFKKVFRELRAILPDISSTRWSKKSDFYSLFLVIAKHSGELPLSQSARSDAATALARFENEVTGFLADEDANTSRRTKRYALAVQRAASDIANRRTRQEVLENLLKRAFSTE